MFPRGIKKFAFLAILSACFLIYVIIREIRHTEDTEVKLAEEGSQVDYQENRFDANRLAERTDVIEEVCRKETSDKNLNSTRKHIYQDVTRELLYCAVPGTSSGFMLRVLAITKIAEINNKDVPILDSVRSDELAESGINRIQSSELNRDTGLLLLRIDSYYKFLFVRNPFARILSIYLKEFSPARKNKRLEIKSLLKQIKKRYGDQYDPQLAISFTQFLSYVLDDVTTSADEFWRPIYKACAPCVIDYDFIGKLETFETDFYPCLEGIEDNSDPKVKIIIEKVLEEINDLNINFEEHWKTIPLEMVNRFVEAYKLDFTLFGYESSLKFYFNDNEIDIKQMEDKAGV